MIPIIGVQCGFEEVVKLPASTHESVQIARRLSEPLSAAIAVATRRSVDEVRIGNLEEDLRRESQESGGMSHRRDGQHVLKKITSRRENVWDGQLV